MSILTASNPLILALVLSLYHVSKESQRILKLKKILICSTIGVSTLYYYKQRGSRLYNKYRYTDVKWFFYVCISIFGVNAAGNRHKTETIFVHAMQFIPPSLFLVLSFSQFPYDTHTVSSLQSTGYITLWDIFVWRTNLG